MGSCSGDLLEAPRQRAVLLDLLELVERRRAHHAQAARRQHRLQQRRQVHRPAGRRAGADDAVQLVDEEDRVLPLAERREDGLEALLEVAAEARAREQRRRVEREDFGARAAPRARRAAAAAAASPSAIAVFPTPASPTNTGPFLRRRQRISIVRCSSLLPRRSAGPAGRPPRAPRGSPRRLPADRAPTAADIVASRRRRTCSSGVAAAGEEARPVPSGCRARCSSGCRAACTPWPSSTCAANDLVSCSAAASTSPARTSDRAGALDVQHGRLQRTAEGERLRRVLLAPARELLDLLRSGTGRAPHAAAADRRRTRRGSTRRPGRAPARRAGARASGAHDAGKSPRGAAIVSTISSAWLNIRPQTFSMAACSG